MEISLFLARAIGLWMVVMSVVLFKNEKDIRTMASELMGEKTHLFLSGLLALVIGILIIVGHNVWVFGWPVIITLFGWASFIKGISFLSFPDSAQEFSKWYLQKVNLKIAAALYFAVGLFLFWMGI